MRLEQVRELLGVISSIDRMPFPEGAEGPWYEIMRGTDFNDARQAVHEHYTSLGARDRSGAVARAIPADIRSRALAIREARIRAEQRQALPAPRPRVGSTGRPADVEATLETARATIQAALAKYRASHPERVKVAA